ncbi:putative phage abortive infection protein [Paenibacillus taichungensis]|uniref:putative phage abortive infection protein n=1 Tax=Paenibacillus taichungensis TaxID=484184 RepID=UPI0038D1264A
MRFEKLLLWLKRKENIMILIGLGVALCAVCVPFIIIHFTNSSYTLESFTDLGTVGDYFGGTTVGLLSLASIIFVTAAIIMQKEELQLQRVEVEKTRKEYEITNATMRKQQFDSTFFNMINLHHNILKEITFENAAGREAIAILFKRVRKEYIEGVLSRYEGRLRKEIGKMTNIPLRNDLLLKSSVFNVRKAFIDSVYVNHEDHFNFEEGEFGYDIGGFNEKVFHIYNDTDEEWLKEKERTINEFQENIENDDRLSRLINRIDFEGMVRSNLQHIILDTYRENIFDNPLKNLKVQAYEAVYNKNENLIGHYYRNLYRIIRLIQDEEFDVIEDKNEKEKKKYRGILRAQLSSYELMMLFYNVTYSRKSEKFRTYLKNTNFFDDHLIQSDFLWGNDKEELELIN